MADSYNIKIGVDSRGGERGVKQFSAALGDALKKLREFDTRAKSAFSSLDRFAKLNTSGLNRSVNSLTVAVDKLNKLKVNRSIATNLNQIGAALKGLRFSGAASLAKLPGAIKSLNAIKIDRNVASALNEIKNALKGFRGPPKSLAGWGSAFKGINNIKINASLPKRIAELKMAITGFKGMPRSAMNIPVFLKAISGRSISATMVTNIGNMKLALAGFKGPSAAASKNLASLIATLQSANAAQIERVAGSLAKLNGLNLNIGRGLGSIGRQGRGIGGLAGQMRNLHHETSLAQRAVYALSYALGGLTIGQVTRNIYETGQSVEAFTRTLSAVATSTGEVAEHFQFIDELTKKMPISLMAAREAYAKFSVAAKLSGMSVADTQKIFESFSVGFSAMGLSAESQKYAFLALEQMISKGTIQMEELRRQLGDHLPGAVQLLADSLDVPVAKLLDMVEAGDVSADALIKMADRVKQQFQQAAEVAKNSTIGQLQDLKNTWTEFLTTIYNSNFKSSLGAMFASLNETLKSDAMQKFAEDIGHAFQRAFTAIAALGRVMAENKDTVIQFFKAFTGYAALIAAANALRLLTSPLSLAAGGVYVLYTVINSNSDQANMNLLKVAGGVGLLSVAMLGMSKSAMKATLWITAFYEAIQIGKGLGNKLGDWMFENHPDAAKNVLGFLKGIGAVAESEGQVAGDKAGGGFIDGMKEKMKAMTDLFGADKLGDMVGFDVNGFMNQFNGMMDQIAAANSDFAETIERNRVRAETNAALKQKQLSEGAQALWDDLDPLQAAEAEYQKQIGLLNEIVAKKGLSVEKEKELFAILQEQTFEKRDPLGYAVRDLQMELDAMKAKTAEQKAVNQAKSFELEMLQKGVVLTREQVNAVADYHKGIAMMNGELGNGIERWTTTVGDFNDEMQNAISDGIGALSDELTDFITGAETDFRGLAKSILRTFVKISLDSILKDLFGAMGFDGQKKGANMAEAALQKLSGLGENITTAQTNVYTSGLAINGVPLGDQAFNDRFAGLPSNANAGAGGLTPELIKKQFGGTSAGAVSPLPDQAFNDRFGPSTTAKTNRLGAGPAALSDQAFSDRFGGVQKLDSAASSAATNIDGIFSGNTLRGPIDTLQTSAGSAAAQLDKFSTSANPILDMANAPAAQNAKMLTLSAKDIIDLKKTVATEWVQSAGDTQGKGIIDTILNRQASGKWGSSIADVVNAKKQFSDINGPIAWKDNRYSVEDLPMSRIDPRTNALVDNWLQQRSMGTQSVVGDNLNYANPNYSSPKNLGWINALEGPRLGKGDAIHQHGTVPELQKYRPGDYGVQLPGQQMAGGIDSTATGSIEQANAALQQTGTQMQQMTQQTQTLGQTVQQAGTQTQTLSQQEQMSTQQAQMSSQMKVMANQQEAMGAQTAGMSIQQAGMNATTAAPQFTQAGTSIQQAGMQASMAGQQAGMATPQMGGFGSGIAGLLGPLSQAIPGLGQFGGAIMQLLSQLMSGMGGGGGLLGGLFSEGGYATAPVAKAMVPAAAFANAPHFANGTPNTSGGMPAVLHPNEAVIPLTKGRKVPVEMQDGGTDRSRAAGQDSLDNHGRPPIVMNLYGVKDADSFKRTKGQMADSIASAQRRAAARNGG